MDENTIKAISDNAGLRQISVEKWTKCQTFN